VLYILRNRLVKPSGISTYGSLKTLAGNLGFADAAKLFNDTLEEEKAADAILSEVALAE